MWEVDLGKNIHVLPAAESPSLKKSRVGGSNVGSEQSGMRKALIIADENAAGWGLVIAIPSTGQGEKHAKSPYALQYGTDVNAALLVNQMRVISTKRLVGSAAAFKLEDDVLTHVEDKIVDILGLPAQS